MTALPGVLYIDTLLALTLLSFSMDYLLLWATAKVTKAPTRRGGLLLGAMLGTAYFVVYYLSSLGILPYFASLRFWPVILFTSIGMVILAFSATSWRQLLRVVGFFYFIAVSAGGAGVAAGYALGWGVGGRLFAAIAAILLIAELGWGVVQRSVWQRLYHVPLEIALLEGTVRVTALLDSGNRLREPLRGDAVIVVDHSAVEHLLPNHLQEVMHRMEQGDLSQISRLLTSSRLSARFRVIPYSSLGNENGLLVGFRPDHVWVGLDGKRVQLHDVVVGISPHNLDPDGTYQALLHPDLVHTTAEVGDPQIPANAPKEGESAHVSTYS